MAGRKYKPTNRRVVDLVWCTHGGTLDEWCVQLLPRPVQRLAVQDVGGVRGACDGLARGAATRTRLTARAICAWRDAFVESAASDVVYEIGAVLQATRKQAQCLGNKGMCLCTQMAHFANSSNQ